MIFQGAKLLKIKVYAKSRNDIFHSFSQSAVASTYFLY